jgi:hypothetical protein
MIFGYDFIDNERFSSPHVSFIPRNYTVVHVWNISSGKKILLKKIFKLKKVRKICFKLYSHGQKYNFKGE